MFLLRVQEPVRNNVVVQISTPQFAEWTERLIQMSVLYSVLEFPNYMMANALTLNQEDVSTARDSLTLFAVLMELLMTICVIYNAPKLISSAKQLAQQLREIVNVIKDTYQFAVLTTRPIEMNVWWSALRSENNTTEFAEITKLTTARFLGNASVEINNRQFVELTVELTWILVILIVSEEARPFIGENANSSILKNADVETI